MNRILKALIFARYGSQADFARELGVDESAVSRVVRRRRILSSEDQERWAKTLGCEPGEIFREARA